MPGLQQKHVWTKDQTQQLVDLARAGHDHKHINYVLGRSYGSIQTMATGSIYGSRALGLLGFRSE